MQEQLTRQCSACEQHLPLDAFYVNRAGRKCRACTRLQNRLWLANNVDRVRRHDRAKHLRREYGITLDDEQALYAYQENRCAICASVFAAGAGEVDHDHATGAVRGLLCRDCNQLLGRAKDSPERLLACIAYLEDPPAPRVLTEGIKDG